MPFPTSQIVKAVLGPTNTGKTHYAIDRMLAHRTGMIGLPLRLLAREVYQRVVERVGPEAAALVTGEERIVPAAPRYWIATVEAMPVEIPVECLAIDEVQTATDFDRGHVFTDRILNARGLSETILLGAQTMEPVIRRLLPHVDVQYRPRFSQLTYAGSRKLSRQPRRSAIVAFSASEVYAIAELLRRERGGAAVVMGALSPRTRNAQVDLYQNGDVEFLVATDAIGMGLNLDVRHIAFAAETKFDGRQTRPLTPAEIGQIAGRAGRHKTDGTFGVTGGADPFDPELVERLESHDFEAIKVLQWRNPALDFASLRDLVQSLDTIPEHPSLTRVPVATDQVALEFFGRNETAGLADSEERVRLAWACCQIPDYRSISPAAHGEIVTRVFGDLVRHGKIATDWIAEQVRFCDNMSGDIDTLSNRIRQIRTWTFVANRKNWLEDPTHWRETTRTIEDRLSDALHEKLTQRFVDRRTSVLMRHLRDKLMVSPEINDKGELTIEGHVIGTIDGLRFTLARADGEADSKNLRSAASSVVAPEIAKRADRVGGAPNEEFVLTTDGVIRWRGEVVAELAEGASLLAPRVIVLADEGLSGPDLEKVQDRLSLWLRHHVNTLLEQVVALVEPVDLEGPGRGIAFQLAENLGILPRSAVADTVRDLDQEVRGKMRKMGIKFGAHHIYLPQTLKPAPRELALILWGLKNGGVRQPGVADLPHVILSGRTSFELDQSYDPRLYAVGGFKVAGNRVVRVDILERLADIIRPLIAFDPKRLPEAPVPEGAAEANGFRVTVEMTSLLGCAGEDFASVLQSLGYRRRRTPKPAESAAPETPEAAGAPAETDADASGPQVVAPGAEDAAAPVVPAESVEQPAVAEAAHAEAAAVVTGDQPEAEADAGQADPAEAAADAERPEAAVDAETSEVATQADQPETVADAEQADPAEAAADAEQPEAPVDGETSEAAAQADRSEAEAAPTQAAAEPEFDEVWFPGGRRPERNRARQRGRGTETEAEGEARPFRRGGDRKGDRGKGESGPGGGKFKDRKGKPFKAPGGEKRHEGARPVRAEKPLDPDSPFAALAVLKARPPK